MGATTSSSDILRTHSSVILFQGQMPVLLTDKKLALLGRQIACLFWGTNNLLFMDKQLTSAFWGTKNSLFLRTNSLWPFLITKQLVFLWTILFEGQTIYPFRGTNTHWRTDCPYWGTLNNLALLRVKQLALFEGQTVCPFGGTNRLPFLRDKQLGLI